MTALLARRRRTWLIGAALLLAIASSASTASAQQYAYEVEEYQRYVSNGAWWVHASATNTTTRAVRWRVSYSARRCSTWSGSVSMARAAGGGIGYDSCQTSSTSLSHSIAPGTSAALMRRDVAELNYYEIRRYDANRNRLIATGYATERTTYQEYAISDHF